MSKLTQLKEAATLSDLAILLDTKPQGLAYVLYRQPVSEKYTSFQIAKRSGGMRTINAPTGALKLVQKKLSVLLQDCFDEIQTIHGYHDKSTHGFRRTRSIITNARVHRRRKMIFNIDLENFFDSINFGRIRGYFISNRNFALKVPIATIIAQIAAHNNALPQGSPCSPVISNLIAQILDLRLIKLAFSAGCIYTRYADDITFSTNKESFPSLIAVSPNSDETSSHQWHPSNVLLDIVTRCGFSVNPKKSHLMYCSSRQMVTGLVVNRKINATAEYRHTIRAMVHRLTMTGSFFHMGPSIKDGKPSMEQRAGRIHQLHGMLGFVDSIECQNKQSAANQSDNKTDRRSSQENSYRQFLLYSQFYATNTPVVLCEGETDNIYLTHAIRSMAREFPALAEVQKDGKIKFRIRLYKYPGSSTARLLGLKDGGSGVLGAFITNYKKELEAFKGPGLGNPVMIIYDNDAGATSIKSVVKSACKISIDNSRQFWHLYKNMYIIPTPKTKIEDHFQDETKSMRVDGKSFHDADDGFDRDKHYGKKVFAHKVVSQYANSIDFSGFRSILECMVQVIVAHNRTVTVSPNRISPPQL